MRRLILFVLVLSLFLPAAATARGPDVEQVALAFRGAERSYFLYAPEGVGESPPVLVLLHGSGRDGSSLVKPWRKLADAEGILLVAPNSLDPAEWSPYDDPPEFVAAVLDHAAATHPFAAARVYLFGHSGGAVWALQLGLLDAGRYAAVAVHAGLVPEPAWPLIDQSVRKTPMHIQVGSRDPFFPVTAVRATAERLRASGFEPELVEIPRHDHDYYSSAKRIDQAAWEFLERHVLGQ